jgi:uncharacterized membrane protein
MIPITHCLPLLPKTYFCPHGGNVFPVIMMSQNRQEEKDRARATHDYPVNLKAELEIRQLHQKLDQLLSHQWKRLVEIQKVQLELLGKMRATKDHAKDTRQDAAKP